jgi:glycosyltransferase involved in cell wall biosynthesis
MRPIVYLSKEGFVGGPRSFRDRLRAVLKTVPEISITNDSDPSKFDIELAFIRSKNKGEKPTVLRVDGCYYRKKDLSKNDDIIKSINNAAYVIFQSNFSAEMCKRIMKVEPKNCSIIYNGIDLEFINSIKPDKTVEPGSFVACSNTWKRRPNKRAMSTLSGFLKAGVDRHLYIIGKYHNEWKNEVYKHPKIHFCGQKDAKEVLPIIKACDYQIHLCHIDSCPNAVIEGLACGLNVLCTNLGGTREIVGDNGIVLDVDKWDFKPLSETAFESLDNLNSNDVAEGIHKLMKITERTNRLDLDIKGKSQQYVQVLLKVSNGI